MIQSLTFAQPLFTAAITPEASKREELLQVVLSSEYPNFKYNINFSLVHVFPQSCNTKLFAIQPTTGIIYLTGGIANISNKTNNTLFCHFNVIVSNSRHSINIATNVSIYNVPESNKIGLYFKKPLKLEDKWSQAYHLNKELRDVFGLLVNVEPVEENGNLTHFLVSLVCPKTNQVLTLDEAQQVFKFGMEDLQIIFTRFQLSMKMKPKGILWKFIFGNSLNEDDDEDEVFLFHNVETLYLYYAVGIGYIFMLEVVLILLVLIVKRVICCVYATWYKKEDDKENDNKIECKRIVLLENADLPPEIRELLSVHLGQSEEDCQVNESTC